MVSVIIVAYSLCKSLLYALMVTVVFLLYSGWCVCVTDYIRDQLTSCDHQCLSVECTFTSPVSIKSGMLVTCLYAVGYVCVSSTAPYCMCISFLVCLGLATWSMNFHNPT